ncbi:PucR family transcriptional regulator [Streptomyces abyssomicinicus]|uniref:PucR family transcriptional regulator n=1 Tax=Streptomyces abyssomicinicus TaxID=574929 RepID=UPI00124FC207|nr:helix-turn-helix domain-containing protein [Streptomyces abyssomicinicus]
MQHDLPGSGSLGTPLERIAEALGAVLTRAAAADATDDGISDVVIAEPGDTLVGMPGVLVLAVGVRDEEAPELIAAAGAAGAACVAVRVGGDGVTPAVRDAAAAAGVPVLGLPAGVRWDTVEAEARRELIRGGAGQQGDLYALAQTVATLTHGLVSIEDTAHRVVAYAGPGEEADELRRRSILGRTCPEPYLAMLRDWGVYQRVRKGEEVVEVAAVPEKGIRRRMVAGINAGARPLGTVWVQEGGRPLAPDTEGALRGAARIAGTQLIDHYYRGDSGARLRSREELAHGLLTGRFNATALAEHLGIPAASGASVVAFDLRDATARGDGTWRDARLAEAAVVVSVHAAAHRRDALVAQACGQIYAMLPEPAGTAGPEDTAATAAEPALVRWAENLVAALRQHTRTPVQACVAGTAARLDEIPEVKLRGHRGLRILADDPGRPVGAYSGLVSSMLVREAVDLMAAQGGIRHPGLTTLVAHDAEHGTELARSLRLYLDAFGDVGPVAAALNVHPNTLRYRVRKAAAVSGLDLDDPEHRLAAMLQLRLPARDGEAGGRAF